MPGQERQLRPDGDAPPVGQAARHDGRPAGVERRERRGPVALGQGQPPVGEEVGSHDGRGVRARAVEGDGEATQRAHPGDAGQGRDLGRGRLVGGHRSDRGEQELAGNGVPEPRRGGVPRGAGDAGERHEDGQRDGERPNREGGATPVAGERAPRQALLRGQERGRQEPDDPPQRARDEGRHEGDPEQDGEDDQRPAQARAARRDAGPEGQPDEADHDEDEQEPAQASPQDGRLVQAQPERRDRRDAARAERRLDGRGEGHDEPQDGAQRQRLRRHGQLAERRAAPPAQEHDRPGGKGDAGQQAQGDPDDPEVDGREQDHQRHLAPGHPRGAQEPDVARALGHRHRQRVEDQERPAEEGDRGNQGDRDPDLAGGRLQGGRDVVRRAQRVRLAGQAPLQRGRHGDGVRAVGQQHVHRGHPLRGEECLRRLQRHDHAPAGRVRVAGRGGQDARRPGSRSGARPGRPAA